MPAHFVGHAAEAWKKYIAPAFWLDATREPAAIAFCELWQEFRLQASSFRPAKHSQLVKYMGTLGLTDESNRSVAAKPENDEHFGD